MPPIRTGEFFPSAIPLRQTPTPTIITAHYLRQIEANHVRTPGRGRPVPLHFNAVTQSLLEPINSDTDKRVTPGDLESFRRTHRFKAPCCLCPLLDGTKYAESRIGIVETVTNDEWRNQSILNGEYVATCAKQRCGYFLCLERFFPLIFLKLQICYPRKAPLAPQDLATIYDIDQSLRRGDGLFQLMTDVVIRGSAKRLEKVHPGDKEKAKDVLFGELDNGMPEDRFWDTFVQCFLCKAVTLRKHFAARHVCHEAKSSNGHPYTRPETPSPISAEYQVPSSPTPTEFNDAFDYEVPSDAFTDVFGDVEYLVTGPTSNPPADEGVPQNVDSDSDFELPTLTKIMESAPRRVANRVEESA